jgi:hypothetical protein
MRDELDSPLFKDIVWGVTHDAFNTPLAKALIRNWKLGVRDDKQAGMIQAIVHPLKVSEAFGTLLPFRKPHLTPGEIAPGVDTDGDPVGVALQTFNSGQLQAGNTGSSKTNVVKTQILDAAPHLDGLWMSDNYKTELRHLRPLLKLLNKDLVIARHPKSKVNMLQADTEDVLGHCSRTADTLTRVLGLPPRARTILQIVMQRLYKEFGNFDGQTTNWPTLFDAYERIRNLRGLNAAARDAIFDRLGAFLLALTPEVGAYRLGWRPRDLARHFIDFELSSASEQVKSAVLMYFLYTEMQRRVREGLPNSRMTLWIVFEDGQRFFSERGEESTEITPAEELAGLIRGTGVGLSFTVQSLSRLPRGLLANFANKCMYRLGSHSDYQALGADMGMNSQQIEWAKLHLRPGLSVWSLADGYRLPFVLVTSKLNVPPVVDDAEADRSMSVLDYLPTVRANEFDHWAPVESVELSGADDAASVPALTVPEHNFLKSVVDNPGKPSSQYAKASGVSGKRALEIRLRLISEGYLREHTVATGQRGRNAQILEPLDKALAALGATSEDGLP